jgi:hypothetical protein
MRKIQKVIIIIYGILVAVACIYVPWELISSGGPFSYGYSLIWKPQDIVFTVDIKRVLLELIAITAVCGVLFVLTLKPKKAKE